MSGQRRPERLDRLFREELSRLIRTELKDPRVRTVTVTGVRTSADLSHATVYVRTLGDEVTPREAIQGLESAAGYVRRVLGRQLHLRRIPELHFEVDHTLEEALRVEELLREARLHRADAADADRADADEPDADRADGDEPDAGSGGSDRADGE
ncbi:MAG: 30S ribosome-binding factor RbfA [Gemmatimonadota bacterium]